MKHNYLILVLLLHYIVAQAQYDIAFTPKQPSFSSMYQTDNYKSTYSKEDRILGNGIFLDFGIGPLFSSYSFPDPYTGVYKDTTIVITSVNLTFGSKWYFTKGEKFRTGLGVQWLKLIFGFNIVNEDFYSFTSIMPLNIGTCNVIKFNEKSGLEMNLFFGLNFSYPQNFTSDGYLGYNLNPVIKYRINKFAIGLDFNYLHSNAIYADGLDEEDFSTTSSLRLVVGFKF